MEFIPLNFADRVVDQLANPWALLNLRSVHWTNAAQTAVEYRGNAELSVLLPSDPQSSLQAYGERAFLKDRNNKDKSVEARIWNWKKRQLVGLSLDHLAIRGKPEKMPKWPYVTLSDMNVFEYLKIDRRRWGFPSIMNVSAISEENCYVERMFESIPIDFQIYNFEQITGYGDEFASLLYRLCDSKNKNLKVNIYNSNLKPTARDALVYLVRPNAKTSIQMSQLDVAFFNEEYVNRLYYRWLQQEEVAAVVKVSGVTKSMAALLEAVPWNHAHHPTEGAKSNRYSHVNTHDLLKTSDCLVELIFE